MLNFPMVTIIVLYVIGIDLLECDIYNATNGSNHWILRQPDQVSITDTMARGTRGPICGNQ